MALPTQPVALSVEQIGELNLKLTTFRHDLKNSLTLIVATADLIHLRPDTAERMWNNLTEQPRRITETISQFSHNFEAALHITQP